MSASANSLTMAPPSTKFLTLPRDFHGEKRSNETHASTSDSEARLHRKGNGQPAKLAFMGHALMENRHALVVDVRLTAATGTAEREAAIAKIEARPDRHRLQPDPTAQTPGQRVDQHPESAQKAVSGPPWATKAAWFCQRGPEKPLSSRPDLHINGFFRTLLGVLNLSYIPLPSLVP